MNRRRFLKLSGWTLAAAVTVVRPLPDKAGHAVGQKYEGPPPTPPVPAAQGEGMMVPMLVPMDIGSDPPAGTVQQWRVFVPIFQRD